MVVEETRLNIAQLIMLAFYTLKDFEEIVKKYLDSKKATSRVKHMHFDIEEEPQSLIVHFLLEDGRVVRWTFKIEVVEE